VIRTVELLHTCTREYTLGYPEIAKWRVPGIYESDCTSGHAVWPGRPARLGRRSPAGTGCHLSRPACRAISGVIGSSEYR